MKRKFLLQGIVVAFAFSMIGCGKNETTTSSETTELVTTASTTEEIATPEEAVATPGGAETTTGKIDLEDGTYIVDFDTDSSMFHVNEVMDGKALLTVENGVGNLHLVMPSKNVLNLYSGFAADAEKNENDWINPSTEEVTYDDGMTEEVYAFDVTVYVMDEEFDLALIGKKNVWYDHKVKISNPEVAKVGDQEAKEESNTLKEGTTIELTLEGGTGKVSLVTPTAIKETEDGYLVTIEWTSKHYDYMIVDDVKYLPVEVGEHSIFEIPVKKIDEPLNVIADTVAMSEPHEIEYTITFDVNSMK